MLIPSVEIPRAHTAQVRRTPTSVSSHPRPSPHGRPHQPSHQGPFLVLRAAARTDGCQRAHCPTWRPRARGVALLPFALALAHTAPAFFASRTWRLSCSAVRVLSPSPVRQAGLSGRGMSAAPLSDPWLSPPEAMSPFPSSCRPRVREHLTKSKVLTSFSPPAFALRCAQARPPAKVRLISYQSPAPSLPSLPLSSSSTRSTTSRLWNDWTAHHRDREPLPRQVRQRPATRRPHRRDHLGATSLRSLLPRPGSSRSTS